MSTDPSVCTRACLVACAILALSACSSEPRPQEPAPQVSSASAALISDAVHSDGMAGFYFLPPMVDQPSLEGTFVPTSEPEVSIQRVDESGNVLETLVTFTTHTAVDGALITVEGDADAHHFQLNWDTSAYALDAAQLYRIHISAGGRDIGFADVDVVDSGRQLRQVDSDAYIPLLDERVLPIKFHLGTPAIHAISASAGGSVSSTDGNATLTVPAGALSSDTLIHADPVDQTPQGYDLVPGSIQDFGPDGLSFSSPATLVLAYLEANLPTGLPEGELTLVHGHDDGSWEGVEDATLDAVQNTVTGSIDGFSRYGAGRKAASLEVSTDAIELALAGETHQLSATVLSSSGTVLNRKVGFKSDDGSVATVDNSGLVTAVAPGATVINVKSGKVSAVVSVVVSGDSCPDDPDKVEPGVCGCGVPDDDIDGDGIIDCEDDCVAAPGATDATCDGVDDDCDGVVDDEYVATETSCGVGACGATGALTCVGGVEVDSCTPGTPASSDATCDGIDDDCDGTADDDYLVTQTSCGVGACGAAGALTCVNGSEQDSCTPGTPASSDATCDGVDDDCDGIADDDYLVTQTSCGVGACGATGELSCVNGSEQDSCTPGLPAGTDASCNNIDDDCDGVVDDGFIGDVSHCGVGACASEGVTVCIDGQVISDCVPGLPADHDISCDGVDDDCNGLTDDGFPSDTTYCGVGACAATGETSCVDGSVVDSCTAGAPAADDVSCDGVDDDCNGQVDDGYAPRVTSCGTGACTAAGVSSCVGGVEQDSCTPGDSAPDDATCDGVDDDCNGLIDDGYVSVTVGCGVGACAAQGVTSCVDAEVVDDCQPGDPAPSDVTCDGVDDDCNGVEDEDYVPLDTSCGEGTCTATGATSCVSGSVQDSCVVPMDDSDGDGVRDCEDGCPDDADKLEPGLCGCGVADTDSDLDGTPDCDEQCDQDPNKLYPGQCGCGNPDTDGDGDGTADCNDGCPSDPGKLAPGFCGCGVSDADSDGDGLRDCEEAPLGTDPNNPDTDDDKLLDPDELSAGTDPLNPDSDGDLLVDGAEVETGNDPLDPASHDLTGYVSALETLPPSLSLNVVVGEGTFTQIQAWATVVTAQNVYIVNVTDESYGTVYSAEPSAIAMPVGNGVFEIVGGGSVSLIATLDGHSDSTSVVSIACGDGIVDATEYCDDGINDGFGCPVDCQAPTCPAGTTGPDCNYQLCAPADLVLTSGTTNLATDCYFDSVDISGSAVLNTGGGLYAATLHVGGGTLNANGDLGGRITQSGGTINLGGTLHVPEASWLEVSGGSLVNAGQLSLPTFGNAVFTGTAAKSLVNRGALELRGSTLYVPAGLTFNQSGTVDTVGTLVVDGVITHDAHHTAGLQLDVAGDAIVSSAGLIDVRGRGLYGGLRSGNGSSGELYVWNGAAHVLGTSGTINGGGTHGGHGAAGTGGTLPLVYGDVRDPLLPGGGGDSGTATSYAGGNGGGVVDLSVGGALTVNGSILADGDPSSHWNIAGSGAGGSVRLRVGELAGSGLIAARGRDNGSWNNAGGGGGGRIAVHSASDTFTGTLSVDGGRVTNRPAGGGTIYRLDTITGESRVIIDNAANVGLVTTLPQEQGPWSHVEVAGGSAELSAFDLTGDTMLSVTGGSLVLATGAFDGTIRVESGAFAFAGVYSADTASSFQQSGGTVTVSGTVDLHTFGTTNLLGGTFINLGNLLVADNAIHVPAGVTFSQSGSVNSDVPIASLRVDGVLTHQPRHLAGLRLSVAGDATIAAGGTVDLKGRGLLGGLRPGNVDSSGEEYQWNGSDYILVTDTSINGGGVHGGPGALPGSGAVPAIYGDVRAPALLGGGGDSGTATSYAGGNGGGALIAEVDGTLTVDGSIVADGNPSSHWNIGGSGAGGSIQLRAGTLAGSGSISARGVDNASWNNAAGGGGGRIALIYDARTFTGSVLVHGGRVTNRPAGGGTIYEQDNVSGETLVIVDHAATVGPATTLPVQHAPYAAIEVRQGVVSLGDAQVTDDSSVALANGSLSMSVASFGGSLDIRGGSFSYAGSYEALGGDAFTQSGGTFTTTGSVILPVFDTSNVSGGTFINRGDVTIASAVLDVASGVTFSHNGTFAGGQTLAALDVGGVLTHDRGRPGGFELFVTGDATIGGSIDVTGRGLRGGLREGNGYSGEVHAWDGVSHSLTTSGTVNGGGTHGGLGTPGTGGTPPGVYGIVRDPRLLGGGGDSGTNTSYAGGNGGGAVALRVDGTLSLGGSIVANGNPSSHWNIGGGGAGGSVSLTAGTFAGTGSIAANGADNSSWNNAGGGGGGRVALSYAAKTFSGSVSVNGGRVTNRPGGGGTVWERNTTTGESALAFSHAATVGPATTLPSGQGPYGDLTIDSGVVSLDGSAVDSATTLTVNGGSLSLSTATFDGTLRMNGGSFTYAGSYLAPTATSFLQTGGTFTTTNAMTLPVFDGSNVSGGTFVNRGELTITSDVLHVASGVTLDHNGTINGDNSIATLMIDGVLTHAQGNADGLQLTVDSGATIGSGGRIDTTGKGLRGGLRAGNGPSGETYVWTGSEHVLGTSGSVNRGATHGGSALSASASIYGDVRTPSLLGAGGDSGTNTSYAGGNGGGRIMLDVGGPLTVNGQIVANGNPSSHWNIGGSGAGGSIWLRATTLGGVGSIAARGVDNASWNNAAAAGGGRIALEYDDASGYTGTFSAAGGRVSNRPAAAGTIYHAEAGAPERVVVQNDALSGPATALPAHQGPFAAVELRQGYAALSGPELDDTSELRVAGGHLTLSAPSFGGDLRLEGGTCLHQGQYAALGSAAFLQSGGAFDTSGDVTLPSFDETNVTAGTFVNRGSLTIASDVLDVRPGVTFSHSGVINGSNRVQTLTVAGVLTHQTHDLAGLRLQVTGDASVEAGGRIDVTGRGLRGGLRPGNASSSGQEYLWNGVTHVVDNGSSLNSGGVHGGTGGVGSGAQPLAYDFADAPVLLGGGGDSGTATSYAGGHGGGAIDLLVGGTLTVTGDILAIGNPSSHWNIAGAGAGGSIRLRAGSLAGGGLISARGGHTGSYNNAAGGGGGRVAVEYLASSFTGSFEVVGGVVSARPGSPGTLVLRDLTLPPAAAVTPALASAAAAVCELDVAGALACSGSDAEALVSAAPHGSHVLLAMGPGAGCALHESGLPQCWGDTAAGIVGGSIDPMTDIAVGAGAACGIRSSDQAVVCFGSDADGLVSGAPVGQFDAVYMGDAAACARSASDGTLSCWGDDASGQVSGAPLSAVAAVAGGAAHFCAVLASGELSCWGLDDLGQVGNAPAGSGFAGVTVGAAHSCAFDGAGAVSCWGDDSAGQSTPPALGAVTALAAGDLYTCAQTAAGALTCWGDTAGIAQHP